MEGVCDGKVYHRIEVLLHVRDGRPRQDGYRQGNRPKHGADRHEAVRRRARAVGDSVVDVDAIGVHGPLVCRVLKRVHRLPLVQGAEAARRGLRRDRGEQHRAIGCRQESKERQVRRLPPAFRVALHRSDVQRGLDARRRDRERQGPRAGALRRHGGAQALEEPGIEHPSQIWPRLEREDGPRQPQGNMDEGVHRLGKVD